MTPRDFRALASPEEVEKLLAKPQSYGNGYQCCMQQISLAQELRETRSHQAHSRKNLGEFNEDIRKILRDAGHPDLPTWLEDYQALQTEVDSERKRLGDECDRLVIEWAEKVGEVETTLAECREAHAMTRRREDKRFEELKKLREENKTFREFIKGVKEFDPRTDHYATGLMDECNDVLGLCRCCGQEVCDDA